MKSLAVHTMDLRGNLVCIKLIFKTALYLCFFALFLQFYFIEQFLEYLKGRTTYSTAIDIRKDVDFPSILVCTAYKRDLLIQLFNDSHPFTILSEPLDNQYQNYSRLNLYYLLSYLHPNDFKWTVKANDLVSQQKIYVPTEPYPCILISINATNQNHIEAILLAWKKNKPPQIQFFIVPNGGWQEKILNEWRYTKPFDFKFTLPAYKSSLIKFSLTVEETKILAKSHSGIQEDKEECIFKAISKFNCPSICSPLLFHHITKLTICSSSSDFKCMWHRFKENQNAILNECFPSITTIQYKGDAESLEYKDDPNNNLNYGSIVQLNFTPISNRVLVKEERYILSTTDFIGSVGGSLGLFLGFSCFTYTSELLDKLLNKLSSLL